MRVIGSKCLKGRGFPFEVIKMFYNYVQVVVVQHHECSKCQWIVHFKIVNFVMLMLSVFKIAYTHQASTQNSIIHNVWNPIKDYHACKEAGKHNPQWE